MDGFRTHLLQEIGEILHQLQVEYCAYLDHQHLFQFPGCARIKQQFFAAVPNRRGLGNGEGMQVWDRVWETFPLSHSVDHMPPDVVDHVPPTFQRVHSQPRNSFSITTRRSLAGRSPNLSHVSRTHRVDYDWLLESSNWDMQSNRFPLAPC